VGCYRNFFLVWAQQQQQHDKQQQQHDKQQQQHDKQQSAEIVNGR
jgi:hypothetical protein